MFNFFAFDIWTLISISIAFLSLIISILTNIFSQKRNAYVTLDGQYKDLLNLGINHPVLRNPSVTCIYKVLEETDKDSYYQYQSYAYMMWNFLETIYDFASKDKNLINTWAPVLYEENKLHYRWFLDHKHLFKKKFQDYVINYLNELTVDDGTMADFKFVYKAMQDEFPLEELKDKDQMLHLLITGKYKMFVFRFKHRIPGDNSMVGYAISYVNEENSMMFLDYLNIIGEYQNCGYGSLVLKLLKQHLNPSVAKGIVFEIEPVGDDINDNKSRRRQFYIKNGASQLNVDYYLPSHNNTFIELDLMVMPCLGVAFIEKEKLQAFVKEAVSTIHSDFTHTESVINKYINNIPDYLRIEADDIKLVNGNVGDLTKILSMLELNFAKYFQVSKEHIIRLMQSNKYKLFLIKNIYGEILGYSFVYVSDNKEFAFLDYLAISKFSQNQGYGIKMVALLLQKFKDFKYGLICETPFPKEGQIDYYSRFVEKSHGHFIDCRYIFPSNTEKVLARLTIYPHLSVNFIPKEAIQNIIKESNIFIHSDVEGIRKIAETNARTIKDVDLSNE